jgi:hypothetical protein
MMVWLTECPFCGVDIPEPIKPDPLRCDECGYDSSTWGDRIHRRYLTADGDEMGGIDEPTEYTDAAGWNMQPCPMQDNIIDPAMMSSETIRGKLSMLYAFVLKDEQLNVASVKLILHLQYSVAVWNEMPLYKKIFTGNKYWKTVQDTVRQIVLNYNK